MGYPPTLADPEIAAGKLERDIDAVRASSSSQYYAWKFLRQDSMHWLVGLVGKRPEGTQDEYWVRLGAEYYDEAGPTVLFCEPDGQTFVGESRWLPRLHTNPLWFRVHAHFKHSNYDGQLICFSFNAYYELTHSPPKPTERWRQGEHTVSVAIFRLQETLGPEFYQCPSA